MKKKLRSLLTAGLISIGMTGCLHEEVNLPYKKYGEGEAFKVGYSDFEIGKNKFKVTYVGGIQDSVQKVMEFTYKRAKELCQEKGFLDYEITNATNDRQATGSDAFMTGGFKTETKKSQSIYSLDVLCK